MTGLSRREQRLLAIGILLAGVTLLWVLVVVPIADGFAERDVRRDQLVALHARNARLIQALPRWRNLDTAQRASATRYGILAPSVETATELSREGISRTVAGEGGSVKTIREQPGRSDRLRLRADLQLTSGQLTAILRKLENQAPIMIIDSVSITADQAAAAGRAAAMDVRIDTITSYSRVPAR